VLLLVVLIIFLGGFAYFAFIDPNPPWGKTSGGTSAKVIESGPFWIQKTADVASGKVTMEIQWTTTDLYKGQVEYGKDTNYGTTSTLESDFVKSHVASLANLPMSTSYHYRIILKSKDNKEWKSDDFAVKTPAPSTQ
jgi:hypothetical protein